MDEQDRLPVDDDMLDDEVPEADRLEQDRAELDADPDPEAPALDSAPRPPRDDADDADVIEQSLAVELDDEPYDEPPD